MATTWSGPAAKPANNRRALMISLLCGLVAAFLVFRLVTSAQTSGGGSITTSPVVVAKQDIPARTVIDASMLAYKDVPASLKLPQVFTDSKIAVGLVTREQISAGEQLLTTKLATGTQALGFSGQVPAGLRGLAVQAEEVTADGGLIQPGDHVDVIAVFQRIDAVPQLAGSYLVKPDDNKAKIIVSATLAQNVLVLATGQRDDQPGTKAPSTSAQPDIKTVTLALSPEDAQRVAVGDTQGTLRLTLHRFDDPKTLDVPPINNDIISVVGQDTQPVPLSNDIRLVPSATPSH